MGLLKLTLLRTERTATFCKLNCSTAGQFYLLKIIFTTENTETFGREIFI